MKNIRRYLLMVLILVIAASPSFARGYARMIVVGGYYPRCSMPACQIAVLRHHHLFPRHRHIVIGRIGHPHVHRFERSIGITRVYTQ
jgi:hypothetical protein